MKLLPSFFLATATAQDVAEHIASVSCSERSEMRYWINKRISGSSKNISRILTFQHCFDMCLAEDSCMGVSYGSSDPFTTINTCYILNYDLATEGRFEDERLWMTAVKCHLNSPSKEAEGKYPFTDPSCSSTDAMRYWDGIVIRGHMMLENHRGGTTEECAQKCQENSECIAFSYLKFAKQCYLKDTVTVTFDRGTAGVKEDKNWSSGVRCDSRSFPGFPADGYPQIESVEITNEVDPCVEKSCSDGCTNDEGTAVCDCRTNSLLILDADQKTCVEKCTVDNGGCDASADCANPTAVGEDVVCSCPDPLIFDETNTSCVVKCTVNNGGCDASAVCSNPTAVGGDVVCSCGAGKQFGSDGRTCTSTADAEKHCPTSTCWTYEMVEGENKCVMKTGSAATDAGCKMYLHCSPDIMDFRWNEANLLGTNTIHNNADTNCAIEASSGDVGTVTPTGVDKMWQHPPASCDSTVTREVVDGEDMIIITKSFVYQGDSTGKNVGSMIYLDDAATVTIDVCCKFMATQSATSDDISIEAGSEVEGKLDAVGSWDGSLKIEFTDNAYAIKKTDAAILGDMHYVKVSWTVGSSPLAEKVNWYVDDCTVIDATDANKKVDIIENQCFASVINAINESTNMLSTSDFKFKFKSFSFNAAGNGSQKITCNINFCLKETECAAETAKTGLTCDYAQALKWVKPN